MSPGAASGSGGDGFENFLSDVAADPMADDILRRLIVDSPRFTTDRISRILISLGLDFTSFHGLFGMDRTAFVAGIKRLYSRMLNERPDSCGSVRGAVGLICLMADVVDIAARNTEGIDDAERGTLQAALGDLEIRRWLYEVYRPSPQPIGDLESDPAATERLRRARLHWSELDIDSLVVHEVGTTSFILRCHVSVLPGTDLALKCVLYPFTRVAPIAEATQAYAQTFPAGCVPGTATVRSSCDKWILLDYVPGPTLHQLINSRLTNTHPREERLVCGDLLESVIPHVLEALARISEAGYAHLDLSPTNIIVSLSQEGSCDGVTLIDLGRNYLFSRAIVAVNDRPGIKFVAPEVRENEHQTSSDLYSAGMMICLLVDPSGGLDGVVPDVLFRYFPDLARLAEDLIDRDPRNRLLIFHPGPEENPHRFIQAAFTDTLKVLSPHLASNLRGWTISTISLLFSSLDHVKSRWHIWRSSLGGNRGVAKYSGYLCGWAIIAATAWYLTFSIGFLWALRDFGVDAFSIMLSIFLKSTDSNTLPVIDSLRASDYSLPDPQNNIPGRIVAVSAHLAGLKYYQNIMSGLTTRPVKGALARATEISIRYIAFAAVAPILVLNLIQPRWWPWVLAVGYSWIALNNLLCYCYAQRANDQAIGFSTVRQNVQNIDQAMHAFSIWWLGMTLITIATIAVAIGLHVGKLHDLLVYAGVLVSINVIVLSIIKATIFGPVTRGVLARAFVVAERSEARAGRF